MKIRKIPVLPSSTFLPDPDFPFAIRRNTRHGSIDLHAHEFVELVLIRRGQATHFSTGHEYPISAGDVFVIHKDQAHGYRVNRDFELVNIMYAPESLPVDPVALGQLPGYRVLFSQAEADRSASGFGAHVHLTPDDRAQVESLVAAIDREMTALPPGYQSLVGGLFTQLVVTLSRLYTEKPHPPVAALLELEPTLDYLRRSFDQDFKLHDLANNARLSVSTLLRRFRLATGTSPVEFLLNLRIERARETLSTTDQRITDIAFACGFKDSNYFTRQFKRHTGLSPRAYRQSLRYL